MLKHQPLKRLPLILPLSKRLLQKNRQPMRQKLNKTRHLKMYRQQKNLRQRLQPPINLLRKHHRPMHLLLTFLPQMNQPPMPRPLNKMPCRKMCLPSQRSHL